MNGNELFCISGLGLGSGQRALLRTTLKLLAAEGVRFELTEKNPEHAHLLFVDDATEQGRAAFAASRPGQVKLVLSDQARVGPNLIVLKRPAEIAVLKKILARLYAKMLAQLDTAAGTAPVPM